MTQSTQSSTRKRCENCNWFVHDDKDEGICYRQPPEPVRPLRLYVPERMRPQDLQCAVTKNPPDYMVIEALTPEGCIVAVYAEHGNLPDEGRSMVRTSDCCAAWEPQAQDWGDDA